MRKRSSIAILAISGIAMSAVAGFIFWRASRALHGAEIDTKREEAIAISTAELRRVANGIEQIGAPARFHDAAFFEGRLYAAGPGGLFSDEAHYRVGDLLPPAPLTCLSPAITAWTGKPELWIGTAGEGMLGFDGSRFRHVRPKEARFRNVTSVQGLKTGHVLFGTQKAGVLIFDGENLGLLS